MDKKAYVLYETDAWHSVGSRVFLGVFTTDQGLLDAVRKVVMDRYANDGVTFQDMDDDEVEETADATAERVVDEFCQYDLQTQGNYEVQLFAEEITLNELAA